MRRVLLVLVLLSGSAVADRHKRTPAAAKPATPAAAAATPGRTFSSPEDMGPAEGTGTHPEGEYGGVVPGQAPHADANRGRPKRPPPKGTLAWIGFEAKDGGAEVFFQSVAPFELAQHVENGALVVELSGVNRLGQNTWRPIDTRFFDNPLARIVARRVGVARASKNGPGHGAGVEIKIAFKNAKAAKEGATRTATEADGYYYAYLSFGGGGGSAQPTVQEPEK